ncbi:hypothetical protein G5B40_11095 [Pikeienuella piscinae]|uniref:Uncharacterized protein n=1 Tax=Pikeienuella piscinae TaxID=2748098 RepID=A0A7L5C253_9RHOB|nr:hypothetical protein [Pikeienuella piscinae]QIE55949.1 hypothetical protein G5B40_11095 [Pikeienuella piscinae]
MLKHKGMPGRFPGTDHQFTIRHGAKKVTPLTARPRHADRKKADLEVDAFFLASLIDLYGEEPFERGNLDAGRLSWVFGREIVAAERDFDPASYEALLRVDLTEVEKSFPEALPR